MQKEHTGMHPTIVCPNTSGQLRCNDPVPGVTIQDLIQEDASIIKYLSEVMGNPPEDFARVLRRQASWVGQIYKYLGLQTGTERKFYRMLKKLSSETNLKPSENAIMTTARVTELRRNASRQWPMRG